MTATCLHCGASFEARRATALYCTPAHRQAHYHAAPNAKSNAKLIPIADSEQRLALVEADNSALRTELAELRRQLKVLAEVTSSLLSRWAYRKNASFQQVEMELSDLAKIGQ